MPNFSSHELAYLVRRLDGALIPADDPGWDARRSARQLAVDQRPAAVVPARSAAGVAATLNTAGPSAAVAAASG
ncbi:hypothetical protein [Nonomuraea sp. JJY05]|uniref:hypothetical protein n=1 Tax=Nonomuraea sp. JJY05 TaxID=3350255 RepID=UPI00373E167B